MHDRSSQDLNEEMPVVRNNTVEYCFWACPEFCVNGVGLKVDQPFFKLDSKASQRRIAIANGHGPFLSDIS